MVLQVMCPIFFIYIVFLIVFIHYKHIKLLVDHGPWRLFNFIVFFIGCLSGLGLYLIGSFQVTRFMVLYNIFPWILQNKSSLSELHYVGAVMLFGGSFVYCSCVTLMSHYVIKVNVMKTVLRATLCFCALGGIITRKLFVVYVSSLPHHACIELYHAAFFSFISIYWKFISIYSISGLGDYFLTAPFTCSF